MVDVVDFTARDIQAKCKENGHPWEIAKAFNSSAVIGSFIPLEEAINPAGNIDFSLTKNGKIVQLGNSNQMINDIDNLICYISKYFMLKRGDIIFTGTPKGVGPVQVGDNLEGFIGKRSLMKCSIK
jgi:2-keto-4-pentenoate hydratase/2-oxohepta-3-ene-1,7-dioic acid hydratase in catechol pathway